MSFSTRNEKYWLEFQFIYNDNTSEVVFISMESVSLFIVSIKWFRKLFVQNKIKSNISIDLLLQGSQHLKLN